MSLADDRDRPFPAVLPHLTSTFYRPMACNRSKQPGGLHPSGGGILGPGDRMGDCLVAHHLQRPAVSRGTYRPDRSGPG